MTKANLTMEAYERTLSNDSDIAIARGAIFALKWTQAVIAFLLAIIFQDTAPIVIVLMLSALASFAIVFGLCLMGAILNGAFK